MLFHRIYQRLIQFCVVDLSSLYMAVLKDRLYTFPRTSRERRSAQTAMWRIAEALTRLVAPIMTFTAEDVWRCLPELKSRPESAHMALFPNDHDIIGEIRDRDAAATLRSDWEALVAIRDEVNKAIEQSRNDKVINSELEAAIVITAPAESYKLLERYRAHLNSLFVVSAVELKSGESSDGAHALAVEVDHAPGQKCERCWNYSTHVGEDASYPTICERCSAALKVIEKEQEQESAGAAS
jgi:isoleucyl-tRNA synthetase